MSHRFQVRSSLLATVLLALGCGSADKVTNSAGAGGSSGTGSGGTAGSPGMTGGGAGTGGTLASGGSSSGSGGSGGSGGSSGGSSGSSGSAGTGGAGTGGGGALIWPNDESHTNSDEWLVEHHDEITELRPRVLLVNFVAGRTDSEVQENAEAIAGALAEGSRYHGYSNADAAPFLNYQIVHFVNLGGQPTRSGNGFGYVEFMTDQTFADKVGFADPNGGGNLTVCELFERGLVNEVWVAEPSNDDAKLYEAKARGQRWSEDFTKIAGSFDDCSGNGCISPSFECNVSVRLGEINLDRGPGCATHAYGHGIEGSVKRNQVPYLAKNASRFFNFDLDQRHGTSFEDFYACPYDSTDCFQYPSPDHVVNGSGMPAFEIDDYGDGCGNVHFAPHSRYQYDYENSSAGVTGRATCEGFGLGAGVSGADATTDIDYDVYKEMNQDPAYSDCGGGWQIYLRQSFPGFRNTAKGVDGQPMKNWWPFLFY